MSDSLWSHELQHVRLPCPSPTPRACSNHVHWVGDAIQSSHPLLSPLLLPSIFPSIRVFSDKTESCHYKPIPARFREKKNSAHLVPILCLSAEMLQLVLFNKLRQLGKKIQSIKCYIKTTVKLQVKTDNRQNPAFKSNFLGRLWFCNVQHILIPSPERG